MSVADFHPNHIFDNFCSCIYNCLTVTIVVTDNTKTVHSYSLMNILAEYGVIPALGS